MCFLVGMVCLDGIVMGQYGMLPLYLEERKIGLLISFPCFS